MERQTISHFFYSNNLLKNQLGFTLLEMLVVVFILSGIALMTVSFTSNADDQFRFDNTRERLNQIRTVVVGRTDQTVNGGPVVGGFVADIGRLPNNLSELVASGTLPVWGFATTTGLWAGWRGPYLQTRAEQSSNLPAFRDDWGNIATSTAEDTLNYGWRVTVDSPAGTMNVVSLGLDGAVGGTGYSADYPSASSSPLVSRDDHQINLKGWLVTVKFINPAGGDVSLPATSTSLMVRFFYPQDGVSSSTDSLPATLSPVSNGASAPLTFQFNPSTDQWVPWGLRALGVVTDEATPVPFPTPDPNPKRLITVIPRAQLIIGEVDWRLE